MTWRSPEPRPPASGYPGSRWPSLYASRPNGHIKTLEQRDSETNEAFRQRVDLVIALLQDKTVTAAAPLRARELAAIGIIRAAIRPKRR